MFAAYRSCWLGLLLVAGSGCIRAPEIVLVDRATALEQQALGTYDELEDRLMRVATVPRPTPLAPDDLTALGIRPAPLVESADLSDADRVDLLLKQRCIGEAFDGTLIETADACLGAADHELIATLVERTNRARSQLWRWMAGRQPKRTPDELRRAWRDAHLKGVVCDGWIERSAGKWEPKKC